MPHPQSTTFRCRGRQQLRCRVLAGQGDGLSYKSAGVDIDAGNELVKRIQKLNPSIGGFSGMVPFGAMPACSTNQLPT